MKFLSSFRTTTTLTALLVCVSWTQAQNTVSGDLDKLMAQMPVETAAQQAKLTAQLLRLGEVGVRELCKRIEGQNEPLDGKVCATLHAVVHAAAKPGAEETRQMVAGVFGEALRSKATVAAKGHLIGELRTLGRKESIGPVAALLKEKALCEPAAQTLVAIGSAEAAAALREAVPKLKGNERVTVIFALGRLRDRAAVPLLLKDAGNTEANVRHAALFALAEIGDPSAEAVLRKAATADDDGECERARHGLLRFATRLAENGDKPKAVAVCRSLFEQAGADDTDIAPGAFYELMGLLGKDEAVAEILTGLGHRNAKVRTAAQRAAMELRSSDATKRLAVALVRLPSDYRAPVAKLLRQRGDPAALPPLIQALGDADRSVRIAAIEAIGGLGKRDVAPQLVAFLDRTPEESEAARSALTVMGDGGLNAALVAALPKAAPAAQSGLLLVLAARDAQGHRNLFLTNAKNQNQGVRHTALRTLGSMPEERIAIELMRLLAGTDDADDQKVTERSLLAVCRKLPAKSHKSVSENLISNCRGASVPAKCALIGAVRAMNEGYPQGLAHVRGAWKDGSPVVRSAALRALAEWPTPEPMQDLLEAAADTKDMVHHVLALRGSIRMAGVCASSTNKEDRGKAFTVLESAMAGARRAEEKRQVLGVLSGLSDARALAIAAGCLSDDALQAEAKAAVLGIVARTVKRPTKVMVAFDKRATARPKWLKDWRDTETDLDTTDVAFRLYSKTFAEGAISLGGNRARGAGSHYIVLLKDTDAGAATAAPAMKEALKVVKDETLRKQLEGLIAQAAQSGKAPAAGAELGVAKVSSGARCKVVPKGLKKGAKLYIDRPYTFKKLPAGLEGTTYVMMANGDKNRSGKGYIILSRGAKLPKTSERPAKSDEKPGAGAPVRVVLNGELLTEYHYGDAGRPYFYPVFAPTGDNITRHWPMKDTNQDEQRDHKHHRSLWFTHGDVNGHDFWSEGRGPKIVQTGMTVDSGDTRCVIFTRNEWRTADGEVVCTDMRRHKIRKSGNSRIIDFEITIRASHGDVVFGDTKEGSMAMRVAPTLRNRGKVAKGSMVNSEGGSGKGIWGKRAKWCDYYGPINGKVVGIAIMDHPGNPRHPTWWHARDYGLCGANPFGQSYFERKPKGTGDLKIKKGESVTFKYRVLVHHGTAEQAGIEKLYQEYARAPESRSLFNGEDFTGWTVPKNNTWWKAQDGIIAVKSGPKKKGSILWTERKFRDFVVEMDFRFGEGTIDSGIFLRTARQQVQLGISGSLKRDMTCSVYVPGRGYPREAERIKELLKPKDWNAVKVEAVGSVYTIWLNGVPVLVYEAQQAIEEGPIGLQLHGGKVMAIDFRNVRVSELE